MSGDGGRQQLKNLLRKTPKARAEQGASFDPGDHTVAEVQEYLAAHPDQSDAVLAAETKGKARSSLVGGDTG